MLRTKSDHQTVRSSAKLKETKAFCQTRRQPPFRKQPEDAHAPPATTRTRPGLPSRPPHTRPELGLRFTAAGENRKEQPAWVPRQKGWDPWTTTGGREGGTRRAGPPRPHKVDSRFGQPAAGQRGPRPHTPRTARVGNGVGRGRWPVLPTADR